MGFEGNGYYNCKWRIGENTDLPTTIERLKNSLTNGKLCLSRILCHAPDCEMIRCKYHFNYYDMQSMPEPIDLIEPPSDVLDLIRR